MVAQLAEFVVVKLVVAAKWAEFDLYNDCYFRQLEVGQLCHMIYRLYAHIFVNFLQVDNSFLFFVDLFRPNLLVVFLR